ncbi:SspB family protein [Chelativorans sp. Marseille-P2723]|uniref:SspB family protein n=1 Tax=Chelativorans sp. Marseille-P2723 TaxID=2709133 RepID=UPI0015709B56|nr:SspB family protein [Chelativorans sp. Marseille-P2723]
MTEDRIRYDILVQEALRGVVRKVLQEVAQAGLPGNHHFFITFLTGAPGVRISSRLKERYPEQMTIVIQYQFWDLKVTDKGFEVVLSFSDVPEKLEVPYSAIRGFYDPSANFEVEFEVKPPQEEQVSAADNGENLPAGDDAAAGENAGEDREKEQPEKPQGGAQVVSLDAFRKK